MMNAIILTAIGMMEIVGRFTGGLDTNACMAMYGEPTHACQCTACKLSSHTS